MNDCFSLLTIKGHIKNNTDNPIIIRTFADGERLTVEIYGQKLDVEIYRKSIVTGEISCPNPEILFDDKMEYPDLYEGEYRFLRYGKAGYTSEGYIETVKNGKVIKIRKIRSDKYSATRSVIMYGRAEKIEQNAPENEEINFVE